ncbi:Basic-leucine zipper domain [Sesbania bispinosa]|nr:Basic-leucine zipper domain [Sesbania bispinosa]
MQGFAKRAIDGDALPPEEQEQGPKRPKVVKPFGHSDSPFQPWQPSWMKDLGIAQESSSAGKPCLHLGISNSLVEQDENKMIIENSTPESDHTDKGPINGGGATSGVDDDGKAAQTDKDQTDLLAPGSGCNTQPEMDPKTLERIIANRASAQRSRMRKIEYVAGLEEKAKLTRCRDIKLTYKKYLGVGAARSKSDSLESVAALIFQPHQIRVLIY